MLTYLSSGQVWPESLFCIVMNELLHYKIFLSHQSLHKFLAYSSPFSARKVSRHNAIVIYLQKGESPANSGDCLVVC